MLTQLDGPDSQRNPAHGLQGHYYANGAFETDELRLPVITGPPAAVRVDPQVAFGRGEGFVKGRGAEVSWAPASIAGDMAVVWKGYIRFPKAGTYYLTTTSRNGSAVYLNQARVALNGSLGNGYIPSASFAYREPGLEATYNEAENTYLVPVEVDGPRVYPIEVRYVADNAGSIGFGIDLYWVRPDAPTDTSGKPLAEIVPAEALYTVPPDELADELARTEVSSAHTTIESDFLYYPAGADSFATLTIRVADAEGRPLAGRRVYVSATSSYGPRDLVEQPSAPTDQNGVTTARVHPAAGEGFVRHTSRYAATVLDDYVDAGQQVEMRYSPGEGISFLPYAFAPYYDGKHFLIAPQPLQVGRTATITVPLTNRQPGPYEVYLTVASKETNIGVTDWNPLGRSQRIVLGSGETKELSIAWTPEETLDHVCFKVIVWGNPLSPRSAAAGPRPSARPFLLAGFISAPAVHAAQDKEGAAPLESRQQNVGAVEAAPDSCIAARERARERASAERLRLDGPPRPADPTKRPKSDRGLVYIRPEAGKALIRSAPSDAAPPIGSPPNGAKVLYSEVVRDGGRISWYRVHPPGGTPGWLRWEDSGGERGPNWVGARPDDPRSPWYHLSPECRGRAAGASSARYTGGGGAARS